MKTTEQLEQEEDEIRQRVRQLPDAQRKEFHARFRRQYKDPDTYAKYAAGVPETVAAYGGTYLVRGVSGEVLEGVWTPKRLVILEFESMERAKSWYHSPEYADLKKLRQSASKGNLIFAQGG